MIKDKGKSRLSERQMNQTSEIKNQNVYDDYMKALISQNQQCHIESQVMVKQITNLSRQLDICMKEIQLKQNQLLLISELCEKKDEQIQEMQKNMIETAQILKYKNEAILRMDGQLQSYQAKWESQISKNQRNKKKMLIENKVLTYSLNSQQKKEKKNGIYSSYNQVIYFPSYKEEKQLSKKETQRIQAENNQYRVRVQGILSILKNQQSVIAEYIEKFDSLTQLLQKKEKQIEAIESSNQYLRNLNQSLINQNSLQLNSVRTLRSSRRKFKVTLNKDLNTTVQDQTTLDINPQESLKKVSTHRVIKTCNSEAVLSTLRFP